MKYSVRFLDNFAMLKDLIEIRSKILDVFDSTEELDKFLFIGQNIVIKGGLYNDICKS